MEPSQASRFSTSSGRHRRSESGCSLYVSTRSLQTRKNSAVATEPLTRSQRLKREALEFVAAAGIPSLLILAGLACAGVIVGSTLALEWLLGW